MRQLSSSVAGLEARAAKAEGFSSFKSLADDTADLYSNSIEANRYYSCLDSLVSEKRVEKGSIRDVAKQELVSLLKSFNSVVYSLTAKLKDRMAGIARGFPADDDRDNRELLDSYCSLYLQVVDRMRPQKGADGLSGIIDSNVDACSAFSRQMLKCISRFGGILDTYSSAKVSELSGISSSIRALRDSVKGLAKSYKKKMPAFRKA